MLSSCCAGKCGCGSGCKCGDSCDGCKMYPDTSSDESTTTKTLILGVTSSNTYMLDRSPEVQRQPLRMKDVSAVHESCNCK